ncbi:MAG: rhamnulokinase [Puniceicoccales bacterium]|nr:rhamnulokinase [Puniceicoccales bacterium]
MKTKVFLAVDLGAGSGRVTVCHFDGSKLRMEVARRFRNGAVELRGGLYWDIVALYRETLEGLRKALADHGEAVAGIGVATWGVDYALIDAAGNPVCFPRSYRDPRTREMPSLMDTLIPQETHFARTGAQPAPITTACQLLAHRREQPALLSASDHLLFLPDFFNYLLCGERACEQTIASTSALYDPLRREWATDVMDALGIDRGLFGALTPPGVRLAPATVLADVAHGAPPPVFAIAGHDTASAVAALPALPAGGAFLSSGTWSLLGVETDLPVTTPAALADSFTNEAGVGGKIRFQKNSAGLWLVQECRRQWEMEDGAPTDFAQISHWCSEAPAFVNKLDVDAPELAAPGSMPARIAAWCRDHDQHVPTSRGEILRAIYEGLALNYRSALEKISRHIGNAPDSLCIVGGGVRDTLLSQLTADASGLPVTEGSDEAASLGNVLMQLLASGCVASIEEGRRLVSASFPTRTREPANTALWDEFTGSASTLHRTAGNP